MSTGDENTVTGTL